jgi:signal peptidase I
MNNFIKHKWKNIKTFTKPVYSFYLDMRFIVWFMFLNEFIFEFFMLEGESMLPTFKQFGDIVLVNKLSRKYKKGDVVCVINPIENDMVMCKRIVYSEGEVVKLRNNNEIVIPKNHYWVEGDNKANSLDSRKFGAISKHLIKGRVMFQIWPKVQFNFSI